MYKTIGSAVQLVHKLQRKNKRRFVLIDTIYLFSMAMILIAIVLGIYYFDQSEHKKNYLQENENAAKQIEDLRELKKFIDLLATGKCDVLFSGCANVIVPQECVEGISRMEKLLAKPTIVDEDNILKTLLNTIQELY